MRVAILVNTFPKLSETFLLNQVTGLIDAGHDVDVYAVQRGDEDQTHPQINQYELLDRTTYLRVKGIDWIRFVPPVAFRSLVDVARDPQHVIRLLSHQQNAVRLTDAFEPISGPLLSRLDRYDAIHAHFGQIANGFRFISEQTDVPFVASFYGYDVKEALDRNPTRYRQLFSSADIITVLSEDMREKLEMAGCPASKTVKQPLAVDVSTFEFSDRTHEEGDPIVVASIARLVEKKGIRYAIDAIAALAKDYDVQYRIAGDGPLRKQLKQRIRRRELNDSVELLGWLDQTGITQLLAESDVFLLPSVTAESGDQEGTPTVLLEAQACGLPVVSTYHAGIPEIVADGQSGLLVPERDIEALTRRLKTLFEHPERWSEMGRSGREYVEKNHSIPAIVGGLEQIYAESGYESE
jgi:colanic acid/amylovoran biosynthesis glycosyltransferase